MLFPLRSGFDTWSRTSASVTRLILCEFAISEAARRIIFFIPVRLFKSTLVSISHVWHGFVGLAFLQGDSRNEPPGDEIFHKPVEEDSLPYFSGAPSSRRFAPWRDCLCTLIPGDHRFFLIFFPVWTPCWPLGEVAVQNVWRCDLTLLDKVLVGSLMLGEVLVIVRTFWTTLAHALETRCSHKQAF